jgi:predicted transposase/invertase (TIGR01784 family)
LHQLKKLPRILDQKVFQRIFKLAQLAQLPKEEQLMYDRTLKAKRDWHNMLDYAQKEAIKKGWEEGMEKGMEKGIEKGMAKGIEKGMEKGIEKGMEKNAIKIALAMHKDGFHIEKIAQLTDLSVEQITKLLDSNSHL